MIPAQILAKVDGQRLLKATEGFVSGAYTITPTSQTATEVRGYVANGDGTQYGVVLTEGRAFCSCPDAMYRKEVCKHAVLLGLHVIRTPKAEVEEERPVNLSLVKTRKGFAFSA